MAISGAKWSADCGISIGARYAAARHALKETACGTRTGGDVAAVLCSASASDAGEGQRWVALNSLRRVPVHNTLILLSDVSHHGPG